MDSGLVGTSLNIAPVSRVSMLNCPQGAGLSITTVCYGLERAQLTCRQFKCNDTFGCFRTASCLCQECTFVGRHAGRSAIPVSAGLAAPAVLNIITALHRQHAVSHTYPHCNPRLRYHSCRQKSPSLTHLMGFQPGLCL